MVFRRARSRLRLCLLVGGVAQNLSDGLLRRVEVLGDVLYRRAASVVLDDDTGRQSRSFEQRDAAYFAGLTSTSGQSDQSIAAISVG